MFFRPVTFTRAQVWGGEEGDALPFCRPCVRTCVHTCLCVSFGTCVGWGGGGVTRMRSFARIRERIDDVRMSKPLLVGALKLIIVTMVMLNILGGAWCVSHLCACSHACVRWVCTCLCVGCMHVVRTISESMAPLYVSCLVGEGGGLVARLRLVFVDGFASLCHRHPPPSPAGTTSASHPRSVGWMRTCPHGIACSSFRAPLELCSAVNDVQWTGSLTACIGYMHTAKHHNSCRLCEESVRLWFD
jgi:hypothetical protein